MQFNSSIVDLADALDAIPGSTIEFQTNPREVYFVLPSGPPPDPSICDDPCVLWVPDWYQVLRNIAKAPTPSEEEGKEKSLEELCRGIPLKGIF
jgi:hypothetical protein